MKPLTLVEIVVGAAVAALGLGWYLHRPKFKQGQAVLVPVGLNNGVPAVVQGGQLVPAMVQFESDDHKMVTVTVGGYTGAGAAAFMSISVPIELVQPDARPKA